MRHGSRAKFDDVVAPRSKFYHGPFGRLCPELSPWTPPGIAEADIVDFFAEIARTEMIEAPGLTPTQIAADPAKVAQLEAQFSSDIPAGYTYFGQFVDHDITFDPASSLMRQNDPNGLLNHRTPRLDLDSVYGAGPAASPHLYDKTDKDMLLTGTVAGTALADLPRNSQGIAIIGDPRNDENAIVAQFQLAFILAHNTLVVRARAAGRPNPFEAARTTLRRLYQHIVWNDLVRRVSAAEVHVCALRKEESCGRTLWTLGLDDIYSWKHQPFMPVEFSVAAYRFGHSMVRNGYQTNFPHRGVGEFVPIFDVAAASPDDLRGSRPLLAKNYVQWDWFLRMTSSSGAFPQMGRKIDTKLSNALAHLVENTADPTSLDNVLAHRNLLRGHRFDLPSGTAMARKFCVDPVDVPADHDALWFYILKEAEVGGGNHLGPLGSTIVCATFAGLLKGDPCSWLNLDPCWTPDTDPLLMADDDVDPGDWTLASIIRIAGLPVDGNF